MPVETKQSLGGKKRAESLTEEQRKKIASNAAKARWKESANLPRSICGSPDSPLKIGDIDIPCYVIVQNEQVKRVLSGRGMQTALALGQRHGALLKGFLAKNNLKPFINNELAMELSGPIRFVRPGRGGKLAVGYEATILVDICDAVLAARDAGVLTGKQLLVAKQCEILTRAFAKVGIIALVDEATGYQDIRARYALEEILDKFIAKDLRKWAKTFPDDFYKEMFRLRDWQYAPFSVKRPGVVGTYTNDIVYERLAPKVLEELKKKNPKNAKGGRKHKHFQWLTEDVGHPRLREHLAAVIALMRASPNWRTFKSLLQRALPKYGTNLELPFDDHK